MRSLLRITSNLILEHLVAAGVLLEQANYVLHTSIHADPAGRNICPGMVYGFHFFSMSGTFFLKQGPDTMPILTTLTQLGYLP